MFVRSSQQKQEGKYTEANHKSYETVHVEQQIVLKVKKNIRKKKVIELLLQQNNKLARQRNDFIFDLRRGLM